MLFDPKSAPKDGTVFLADFGYPWLLVTVWNEHDENWCYSYLQSCPMSDGTSDTYFENEWTNEGMRGWLPIPCAPQKAKGENDSCIDAEDQTEMF